MPKQKIEIEVDVPEGYEATGEYRHAARNEPWLSGGGEAVTAGHSTLARVLILRRVKQYREPVLPADWGKTCEFSDAGITWVTARLLGFDKITSTDKCVWLIHVENDGCLHVPHCRIEKEPTE